MRSRPLAGLLIRQAELRADEVHRADDGRDTRPLRRSRARACERNYIKTSTAGLCKLRCFLFMLLGCLGFFKYARAHSLVFLLRDKALVFEGVKLFQFIRESGRGGLRERLRLLYLNVHNAGFAVTACPYQENYPKDYRSAEHIVEHSNGNSGGVFISASHLRRIVENRSNKHAKMKYSKNNSRYNQSKKIIENI